MSAAFSSSRFAFAVSRFPIFRFDREWSQKSPPPSARNTTPATIQPHIASQPEAGGVPSRVATPIGF